MEGGDVVIVTVVVLFIRSMICQIRTMFRIDKQKDRTTFDLVLSNFVF